MSVENPLESLKTEKQYPHVFVEKVNNTKIQNAKNHPDTYLLYEKRSVEEQTIQKKKKYYLYYIEMDIKRKTRTQTSRY